MLTTSLMCLALNIYHEARSDSPLGQEAVGMVTMNRVYSDKYPNTVCDVVYQAHLNSKGSPIRNKCQFSWYCDGKHDRPQDEDRWQEAQLIAYNMLTHDKFRGITEGATHYHATYVSPKWAKDFALIGRIGAHVYYRWEK